MDLAARGFDCPRLDSGSSGETGSFFLQMSCKLAVGVPTMGEAVLLLGCHFSKGLLRSARLEPGVPSEVLISSRLHQNLAPALAEKDLSLAAVPVRDAALRSCGAVVQRIRDGGQSSASRGFQQPANIGSREVAQLVESERDVLDDETVIALGARDLEFVTRDLFHGSSLNFGHRQSHPEKGHAEDPLGFEAFVWIGGDENQLVFVRHAADSTTTVRSEREGRALIAV